MIYFGSQFEGFSSCLVAPVTLEAVAKQHIMARSIWWNSSHVQHMKKKKREMSKGLAFHYPFEGMPPMT
jgi:hypothetical protein